MVGCGKEIDKAQPKQWSYVWNDTGEFKIPDYVADFQYSNPCGVEGIWYSRKYTPMCIDCAKSWGYIW